MSKKNDNPAEGETYHCKKCEMEILVIASCTCDSDNAAFFSCCGEQLERTERKAES